MRSAVVLFSLVAAVAAEAPYHLPRPAPQAPAFHYPAPSPPPAPRPPAPAPQPNFGYQYNPPPPPSPPAPQPQPFYPQPAPQPQPYYPPAPAPQPQPAPIPQPAPNSGYNYPSPPIQPFLLPQPTPQPQPARQPQPAPQPIAYRPPSTSYGVPQINFPQQQPQPLPQPQPSYHVPLPQVIPQPQPQPQPQPSPSYGLPQPQIVPQPAPVPISYYQPQRSQAGYSYQSAQSSSQFPLQTQQSFGNSQASLSSYQADSNQYRQAQVQSQSPHNEALDSIVVNRVSNIIKDDEHSSAKSAGYQSLVSGISLENARPSVELISFTHTSSLGSTQSGSATGSQSSGASSTISGPSSDYGLPVVTANSQSSGESQSQASFNLLPQAQPSTSYGSPN